MVEPRESCSDKAKDPSYYRLVIDSAAFEAKRVLQGFGYILLRLAGQSLPELSICVDILSLDLSQLPVNI